MANEVDIQSVDDVHSYVSRLCYKKGVSGYSIERGITDLGMTNASGARHFVTGQTRTVTIDTLFKLCSFLDLSLTISEKAKPKKGEPDRSSWDWQQHKPAYERLLTPSADKSTVEES